MTGRIFTTDLSKDEWEMRPDPERHHFHIGYDFINLNCKTITIENENEIIFDDVISVIKQLQSDVSDLKKKLDDVSDFKKKLDEIYHNPEKHILTVNAAITIQRRWRYRRSYKEALGNWKDRGCSEYGNQKVMQKIKEEIK